MNFVFEPHIVCICMPTSLKELNKLSASLLVMLSDVQATMSCFDIEENAKIIHAGSGVMRVF